MIETTDEHFDPLNKIIWQRAIRNRNAELTTRQGKLFSLNYTKKQGKVWFKIVNGSRVPCGWLDIKSTLDEGWLR